MSVLPWKHHATRAPYARFAQKAPTSHARWHLTLTNEVTDEAYSGRGYNVVGPLLDLAPLNDRERVELQQLASMLRRDQSAEQLAREQELLAKVPRLTVSGGYDIDTGDDALTAANGDAIRSACDELHRRIVTEESSRGMALRQAWSGNPARGKRHLEWGGAVKGHTNLLRAALGRARDVCKAAGLVPRQVTTSAGRTKSEDRMWVLPDDPTGALAFVDLSNLERSPGSRSSTFRALGGWHKDRTHRKALIEGSPDRGSALTPDVVADGLRLYEAQERENGRSRTRAAALSAGPREITLPVGRARPLPYTTSLLQSWWQPGAGHNLRMSYAGTFARCGLMSEETITHLIAEATGNRDDARTTVQSTIRRLQQNAPVRGSASLRDDLGSWNVAMLAWAMTLDMREYAFAYVWSRIAVTRTNEPHELKALTSRLEALAATTENADDKNKVHKVRRRLQASAFCGKRLANGRCPCCNMTRCRKRLMCGDPSCPVCTLQKIRDVIELVKVPRHTTVIIRTGFASKEEARDARNDSKGFGDKPPLALYNPTPEGTWELTLLINSEDRLGVSGAAATRGEGDMYDRCLPHVTRNWIARALLMRHVTARHAIESAEAPLEVLLEAYRKHTASGRGTSIAWPTKEQMRQLRIDRATKARAKNAENADAADPDECECPESVTKINPAVVEVVDTDTGRVVVDDLASTPTLAQVIAHERGEKIRLHKRRRFRFRFRSRAASS